MEMYHFVSHPHEQGKVLEFEGFSLYYPLRPMLTTFLLVLLTYFCLHFLYDDNSQQKERKSHRQTDNACTLGVAAREPL